MIASVVLNWEICGWAAEQPPPMPAEEQPEVLTSGPVHEAFAEPVNLENQPGIVAPSQPPANIEEVPPADRPVGNEFVWVPGYWGWDPSRNGYVWISGCWRAAPPRMYWVPGYWTAVAGGWQWVAGFWSPVANNEIEYLPAPPPLTDVGPPGPAPAADRIWVPPCWYWNRGQYIWRSGYWVRANPDWMWVPSHYLWTPRGYVFVAGHWDYSLRRRGMLFAPVYFPRHFYGRPRPFYPLSIVVDIGNLEFGLFTYPRYSHYYFGDYYGNTFISIGMYPRFECVSRHTWYDPIYFHDRWRHRKTAPRWEEHERQDYKRRLADTRLRPPRTYREMKNRTAKLPELQRRAFNFAEPMKTVIVRKKTAMKFEPIKSSMRKQLTKQSAEIRAFREQRSKWESQGSLARKGRPTIERVPPAESRKTAAPTIERKGQEMKPSERKEVRPAPGERKGPEAASTGQRGRQVQPPAERRAPAERKKPEIRRPEGPQKTSERVKVPTPPVSGKRGVLPIFKKGPPSQPAEERKSENKKTRKKQEEQKRGEQGRGGDEGDRKSGSPR